MVLTNIIIIMFPPVPVSILSWEKGTTVQIGRKYFSFHHQFSLPFQITPSNPYVTHNTVQCQVQSQNPLTTLSTQGRLVKISRIFFLFSLLIPQLLLITREIQFYNYYKMSFILTLAAGGVTCSISRSLQCFSSRMTLYFPTGKIINNIGISKAIVIGQCWGSQLR